MRILCLGDSITDCGRLFSDNPLGGGYVSMVQTLCRESHPDWKFINRGIDGFTVSRLLQNARSQYLSLRPDLITILIGINDIGLIMNTNRTEDQKQELMKQFFSNYEALLRILLPACPAICLIEPFVFSCPQEFTLWQPYVAAMSQGIQQLADTCHLPYLPLREQLRSEAEQKGFPALTIDGVHLTHYGHTILAENLYNVLCTMTA